VPRLPVLRRRHHPAARLLVSSGAAYEGTGEPRRRYSPVTSGRGLGASRGPVGCRGPVRRRAAAAAAAAVLLAGCTGGGSETTSGTQRFVSGDGVVHYVPAASRGDGPDVSGETLDGERLDLGTLRAGGVAVVNVWGSWCAPCKKEQGALERVSRATRSRGVRFVGINIRDSSRTPARRHVERYGVTYPSIYDPSARLLPRFEIAPKTIPSTYVIDPGGRIAAYVYGPIEERPLADLVDRVLAETA
jgi:thiol-disulfide isomerase/thioredoxin